VLAGPFDDTEGYQAMWLVCGGTVLVSLWFVRLMARAVPQPSATAADDD
jgi:hypothetical protein